MTIEEAAKARGIDLSKTTLPPLWWPLVFCESPLLHRGGERGCECAVCGATYPLNEHHIVPKARGKILLLDGTKIELPTITLCGIGNHGKGPLGYPYCHGMCHMDRLHFRAMRTEEHPIVYDLGGKELLVHVRKSLEFLITDRPVKYQTALMLEGWREL